LFPIGIFNALAQLNAHHGLAWGLGEGADQLEQVREWAISTKFNGMGSDQGAVGERRRTRDIHEVQQFGRPELHRRRARWGKEKSQELGIEQPVEGDSLEASRGNGAQPEANHAEFFESLGPDRELDEELLPRPEVLLCKV
jgi:hypothetical protein